MKVKLEACSCDESRAYLAVLEWVADYSCDSEAKRRAREVLKSIAKGA